MLSLSVVVVDRFYIALFSALGQTHCACMCVCVCVCVCVLHLCCDIYPTYTI